MSLCHPVSTRQGYAHSFSGFLWPNKIRQGHWFGRTGEDNRWGCLFNRIFGPTGNFVGIWLPLQWNTHARFFFVAVSVAKFRIRNLSSLGVLFWIFWVLVSTFRLTGVWLVFAVHNMLRALLRVCENKTIWVLENKTIWVLGLCGLDTLRLHIHSLFGSVPSRRHYILVYACPLARF